MIIQYIIEAKNPKGTLEFKTQQFHPKVKIQIKNQSRKSRTKNIHVMTQIDFHVKSKKIYKKKI